MTWMRPFARSVAIAAVLASAATVGSPAFADEPSRSLADGLTGIAKAEYAAGKTLFEDGDFSGALVKFKIALDASKDPRLLWNLGACERGLRHYAEAIRDFERYKTEAATRITDQDRGEADTVIAGLRPFVASLSVRANVEGATVVLDDQEVGPTPLTGTLIDLGNHRLVVKKTEFKDYSAELQVTGNADILREVHLDAVSHEGKLAVHTGPGDTIFVDGRSAGVGEYSVTLPSGEHQVRVTAQGKKSYEMKVLIADGQLRSVDVALEKEGGLLPIWGWIGLGGAVVVGLSVATFFALKPKTEPPSPVVGTIPPGTVAIP